MLSKYCSICRDPPDVGHPLQKCVGCKAKFHLECISSFKLAENYNCQACCQRNDSATASSTKQRRSQYEKPMKSLLSKNKLFLAKMMNEKYAFLQKHVKDFEVFTSDMSKVIDRKVCRDLQLAFHEEERQLLAPLEKSPEFILNGCLRDYQLQGVSTLNSWFLRGVGGILADEMGLGKTIQTISFLAGLKHRLQLTGPHLVVTPLAVLQNWANELDKFCPTLTFKRLYGTISERKQLFSDELVNHCQYDVYLTTYDTLIIEEAFFTDSWPWVTVTIDEGHRIKNENAKLRLALSRLRCPFRLLLTGTPLQNNLHELWALLDYILPEVFNDSSYFDAGYQLTDDVLNKETCLNARRVLDRFMMMRRIKFDVEKTLLKKRHFKLTVPLTRLQKRWYKALLYGKNSTLNSSYLSILSSTQLMSILFQLRKVVNHPKQILLKREEEREKEAKRIDHALHAGSEFISRENSKLLPPRVNSPEWKSEQELRDLVGERLVLSCGKLMVLDRLLLRLKQNQSRCLIFSQFTETLDILEEYVRYRFGPVSQVYFRLDGSTNRILRELNTRAFNHPDSTAFIYLISTRAGGMGINLATADSVILYDSSWNPQDDLQAQDRAHRIGQKKQVTVYRLVSEHTFEERVLQMADKKQVLDTLVIAHQSTEQDISGIEGNQDSTLSITELVSMLVHGSTSFMNPSNTIDEAAADVSQRIDQYIEDVMSNKMSSAKEGNDISADGAEAVMNGNNSGNLHDNRDYDDDAKEEEEMAKAADAADAVEENQTSSSRKRRSKAPKRFDPSFHISSKPKKRRVHEEMCFCCQDGGLVVECDDCPKVYHMQCLGRDAVPKSRFTCPWHSCIECDRSSSNSGGMLFRCMSCPVSYCFDCWPKSKEMVHYPCPPSMKKNFETRGYELSKNILFYRCVDCEEVLGKYVPPPEPAKTSPLDLVVKQQTNRNQPPPDNSSSSFYSLIASKFAHELQAVFQELGYCEMLIANQSARVYSGDNMMSSYLYLNLQSAIATYWSYLDQKNQSLTSVTTATVRPISDSLFMKLLVHSYRTMAYYQYFFQRMTADREGRESIAVLIYDPYRRQQLSPLILRTYLFVIPSQIVDVILEKAVFCKVDTVAGSGTSSSGSSSSTRK